MQRSRWRPSPALVIACLALFVALGGTVLAATKIDGRTIKVGSLPGNRLEVGSLPGNRLRPGSIAGTRLAPRSVKGDEIDATTLGQVPSAAHADSATTARHAETAVAAEHAADATTINGRAVGCSQGEMQFASECWEVGPRATAVNAFEAAEVCASAGGELPRALAMLAFMKQPGVKFGGVDEWTGDVASVGPPNSATVTFINSTGALQGGNPSVLKNFRCVTPLLN
jgi:hypothetical protein